MKIASFAIPMVGGVYGVASRLRRGLAGHGIDMQWIGVGKRGIESWNEPGMESERRFGHLVAPDAVDEAEQAKAVIDYLVSENFSGMLVDILGGRLQANLARYVPDHLFRVLVVHSITPGTYEYARAVRDHCHATVAVSPRIRDDLVRRHRFRDDAVSMVPNGVELAGREVRRDARGPGLKVLVLGRVEHEAKGVLDVPKIATLLRDTASTFTIAGDGPDLARLQRACEPFRQRVALLGRVSPGDVPGLLARHDVLLLPSRFEGFPLALIEAMAFGCVPVASLISGVTNFVVEHGKTGLLFPVGSVKAAAAALQTLSADRELLDRMSVAGATIARRDFDAAVMARKYAELLRGLCVQRPPIAPPLDIGAWQYPSELRPSWRSSLPRPVKNVLRIIRERSRYMSAT